LSRLSQVLQDVRHENDVESPGDGIRQPFLQIAEVDVIAEREGSFALSRVDRDAGDPPAAIN